MYFELVDIFVILGKLCNVQRSGRDRRSITTIDNISMHCIHIFSFLIHIEHNLLTKKLAQIPINKVHVRILLPVHKLHDNLLEFGSCEKKPFLAEFVLIGYWLCRALFSEAS